MHRHRHRRIGMHLESVVPQDLGNSLIFIQFVLDEQTCVHYIGSWDLTRRRKFICTWFVLDELCVCRKSVAPPWAGNFSPHSSSTTNKYVSATTTFCSALRDESCRPRSFHGSPLSKVGPLALKDLDTLVDVCEEDTNLRRKGRGPLF